MLFETVVSTSGRIRATRSRKAKVAHLSELLKGRSEAELDVVVAWLSGELVQGRIGVGYATALEAARTPPAEATSLTVAAVDGAFAAIRDIAGAGSKQRRFDAVAGLLGRATGEEQRFITGLLTGELRQGAQAGIMVEGIAAALDVPPAAVRRAAMLGGDLRLVASAAHRDGAAGLAAFQLEVFRPLQPMLAQTAEDGDEAIERLGEATLEQKLDGARIQVHKRGEDVRIYTRGLKEVTRAVPEVVEAARALAAEEVVLDGEVIAMRADGRPHAFQTTMRRFGRKLEARVADLREALPLTPFYFDCLHVDGETLVDAPARERLAALDRVTPPEHRVERVTTRDPVVVDDFLRAVLEAGHEGIMAKATDAPYEAGSRGRSWLKIKAAHTLDLVVLAADWGSGRRRGALSNLHLGARDEATGGFVMLGKTFKGMTDAMLAWQTEALQAIEVRRTDWTVYVRPELVVEIAFNEIQSSPKYVGGLALRFARVKGYRPDKRADEADTLESARSIHDGRVTLADRLKAREG